MNQGMNPYQAPSAQSLSQQAERDWKSYHEMQNKTWKDMKDKAAAAPTDGSSADAGYAEAMMYEAGFGLSGRGLSPLSGRNKKSRRGAAAAGMPMP